MGREFASAAARWCHLLDIGVRPEIVAVCDPNLGATKWFTDNFPIAQVVTDYSELLSNPEVDAVYCAVPHHLHADLYVPIIEAGKHLLAEKPFGIDLAACEKIIAKVESHPEVVVRCSSEFPFFPAVQKLVGLIESGTLGEIIEVRAGFYHSSDLDPTKPINWKRQIATCGEYGCMGDLGMHVLHVPLRVGWKPKNVRALLSNIIKERPDGKGGMANCETWDNAILACEAESGFPLILETKRISPGDMNTWTIEVLGTEQSAKFSTKNPKTLLTMPYQPGQAQAWHQQDVGYDSCYKTITGGIFEFGFSDAILQMWAAFVDEVAYGQATTGKFRCALPTEALASHYLFTAALESQRDGKTVTVRS